MERNKALALATKYKAFKLYINQSNKKVWEVIRFAESQGISPSDYICKKVLEGDPSAIPSTVITEEQLPPKDLIERLIDISKEYEENGINERGLDITYILPRMFEQGKITHEEMVVLTIFIIKFYITIVNTGNMKFILQEIIEITSKRDISNTALMNHFKQVLLNNLQIDEEIIRKENERLKAEAQKREREQLEQLHLKLKKDYEERIKFEKQQWELLHPDIPFWAKDLDDEEIELSDKIVDNDLIIVGSIDDVPEQEDDEELSVMVPNQEVVVEVEQEEYESCYQAELEKLLNASGIHIN
jgi:hypothetical protein